MRKKLSIITEIFQIINSFENQIENKLTSQQFKNQDDDIINNDYFNQNIQDKYENDYEENFKMNINSEFFFDFIIKIYKDIF